MAEEIVVTSLPGQWVGCSSSDFVFCPCAEILEGLRGSLDRLQLDYVDIVFANKSDSHTPMEGTYVGVTRRRFVKRRRTLVGMWLTHRHKHSDSLLTV